MYVPQIAATVIYTVYKTVLLIFLAKAISSLCSWTNRYDLAKIMEHGSYAVLYTSVFSRTYRNYMTFTMLLLLFLVVSLETLTNLLPTIATRFMPFQLVSFTEGVDETYFEATYATPQQSATIPSPNYSSSDNPMEQYCKGMELCQNDGSYIANIPKISPTMQVSAVEHSFITSESKFATDMVNVSTEYCELRSSTSCMPTARFGAMESDGNFVNVPGFPFEILTYFNSVDESSTGVAALMEATGMQILYGDEESEDSGEFVDRSPIIRMLYLPMKNDILSVTHLSRLLYSNGQQSVILVQKVALHNLSPEGNGNTADYVLMFGDVFNNSQLLYDISLNHTSTLTGPASNYRAMSNITMGAAYTSYIKDNYLAIDFLQRTIFAGTTDTILKLRMQFGVYVITDPTLPEREPTRDYKQFLTNYNATRFENRNTSRDGFKMREAGFYDSMLDGFQDQPSNDLFMYALLNGSNNVMYGVKGYQEVVADISPVFLIVTSGITLALFGFFILSKYTRDPYYFYTLYQAIGHTDTDGCVRNADDEIPPVLLKDGVVYAGDKVVTVQDRSTLWTEKYQTDNEE